MNRILGHRIVRTKLSQEYSSAKLVRENPPSRCRRKSRCRRGRRCGRARIVALNVRSSGLCMLQSFVLHPHFYPYLYILSIPIALYNSLSINTFLPLDPFLMFLRPPPQDSMHLSVRQPRCLLRVLRQGQPMHRPGECKPRDHCRPQEEPS